MTRTILGTLIGLCASRIITDWTAALDTVLGLGAGMAALRLWTSRQQASEAEQRAYRQELVAAGWQQAHRGTDLLTAQRVALPSREP